MTPSQTTTLPLLVECGRGGAEAVDWVTSIAGALLSFLDYLTRNYDILLQDLKSRIRTLSLCLLLLRDFALLLLLLWDTATYLACARLGRSTQLTCIFIKKKLTF